MSTKIPKDRPYRANVTFFIVMWAAIVLIIFAVAILYGQG